MATRLLLSPPVIDRMIREPAFQTYGFCQDPPREELGTTKVTARHNCRRCRRRANRQARRVPPPIDYNAFKLRIVGLDTPQREDIKKKLGIALLKVRYRDRRGQPQTRVI